jgi:hypothetical protein
MRRQQIALGLVLLMGCCLVQGAALAQEYRGTLQQQLACTPDVWRLCSDQIPDVHRIVACLRQNTPQLSRSCRAVFEPGADTPQPLPPGERGRAQPNPVRPPPPQYDNDDDD